MKLIPLILATLVAGSPTRGPSHFPHFEGTRGEPGKEGLMILVEYPPGSQDPIHRHNAHAFVYVLEGSIVMLVKGGNR